MQGVYLFLEKQQWECYFSRNDTLPLPGKMDFAQEIPPFKKRRKKERKSKQTKNHVFRSDFSICQFLSSPLWAETEWWYPGTCQRPLPLWSTLVTGDRKGGNCGLHLSLVTEREGTVAYTCHWWQKGRELWSTLVTGDGKGRNCGLHLSVVTGREGTVVYTCHWWRKRGELWSILVSGDRKQGKLWRWLFTVCACQRRLVAGCPFWPTCNLRLSLSLTLALI